VETGFENGTGGNQGTVEENHVSHHDSPTTPQSGGRQTSSSGQLHFETGL